MEIPSLHALHSVRERASAFVGRVRTTLFAVVVAIAIIALGAALYFRSEVVSLRSDPEAAARKEADAVIKMVGQLIVLPEDERPTVATVSDPELLKDQPFFARAKKGDKVLIYTNAKKAILYDPALNKIVEVVPLNIGDTKSKN